MKERIYLASVLCCAIGLVASVSGKSADARMCLDASQDTMSTVPDTITTFCQLPLRVELSVCANAKEGYNIFIANQSKASPWHWEIFSLPGSGNLSAYIPGFAPDHLHSNVGVVDGKWHAISLFLTAEKLELTLDGKVVASEIPQKNPVGLDPRLSEGLYIGSLSDYSLGICNAQIDDVQICSGAQCLAAWNFDNITPEGCEDVSGNGHNLRAKSYDYVPMPVLEDTEPWREATLRCVQKLNLQTSAIGADRDAVYSFWKFNFDNYGKIDYLNSRYVEEYARTEEYRARIASQAYDSAANILVEDRGATGTVLRQARALLELLESTEGVDGAQFSTFRSDLGVLEAAWAKSESSALDDGLYFASCSLRRAIMFANPLLDFDDVLCVTRGSYQGSVRSMPGTSDGAGGHFMTQYYGYTTVPGGGLYRIHDWKTSPKVFNVVQDSVVQSGRYAGQKLDHGAFCAPDLSFDGKTIVFSWSENRNHHLNGFTQDRTWHVFRVDADGRNLIQLTDGEYDDFDACWLPNGRIVFISERRGGYIRCFDKYIRVPNYTMFSMKSDGTDMIPISYFETAEWNPSVNNDGMLVYTRWDYTDRENCIGGRFWICGPDGTNPRAPHGNYPDPMHSLPGNRDEFMAKYPYIPYTGMGSRLGTPLVEMGIRAIPDSHLYVMTAAPHHGQLQGSLAILDLRIKDDNAMSQVRRLTPDELFPETEYGGRQHYKYATPWPLNGDFFLANCWEDIILLDRFGNQELLCGIREINPAIDERFRMLDPIPLVAHKGPPVLPTRTWQGERASTDAPKATVSVMNVYESDLPLPPGVKIKYLRVVQNILKTNYAMGEPMGGYERENTPRIPLGIVPVEEDGSVYFEAPVAKELMYQLLDEEKTAVHAMRSVSYVFPGEHLSCAGCHEPTDRQVVLRSGSPLAMQKPPARLQRELDSIEPISYYRQIKSIFDTTCLPCHQKANKGLQDMSYEAVREDTFWFSGGMRGNMVGDYPGVHGGSRTIPGKFGARASRIGKALLGENHKRRVSEKERRTVLLWLDCNSLRLGAFDDEAAQLKGELVWPSLDVDSENVQGIDGTEPGLQKNFWHENRR